MPKYTKVLFFYLMPSVLILFLGFCWLGIAGLVGAFVLSVFFFFYCYFFCSDAVLSAHRAVRVEKQNSQGLIAIVDHLASKLQLPVPAVYMVSDASPYAFSTGRDIYNSSIAVSRGLLSLLTYDELEAVIAHEMIRISRGETLAHCFTAALLLVFLRPVKPLRLMVEMPAQEISLLRSFYSLVMTPFVVVLLRLTVSRKRSFNNDSKAAALCAHPETLAFALRKIHRNLTQGPVALRLAVSHLYVVNPIGDHPWLSWVESQPSAAERIQRLLEDCNGRTKKC